MWWKNDMFEYIYIYIYIFEHIIFSPHSSMHLHYRSTSNDISRQRLLIKKESLNNKYITIYRGCHFIFWISASSHATKSHIFESLPYTRAIPGFKNLALNVHLEEEICVPHTQRVYVPFSGRNIY